MGKSSSRKHRVIEATEVKKRGCRYCPSYSVGKGKEHRTIYWCANRKCPYYELDAYETYDEYLKALVKRGTHGERSNENG